MVNISFIRIEPIYKFTRLLGTLNKILIIKNAIFNVILINQYIVMSLKKNSSNILLTPGLPTAVWYWWSRSSKFSGEQVLLDTTQLYYYFFHKTPHMMLKRVLMVLAASLEFERGHNHEIVERPTGEYSILIG